MNNSQFTDGTVTPEKHFLFSFNALKESDKLCAWQIFSYIKRAIMSHQKNKNCLAWVNKITGRMKNRSTDSKSTYPTAGQAHSIKPTKLCSSRALTATSGSLTWDCALMSAPSLTRTLTTSACPARDAMWRAVFPFCFKETKQKRLPVSKFCRNQNVQVFSILLIVSGG